MHLNFIGKFVTFINNSSLRSSRYPPSNKSERYGHFNPYNRRRSPH